MDAETVKYIDERVNILKKNVCSYLGSDLLDLDIPPVEPLQLDPSDNEQTRAVKRNEHRKAEALRVAEMKSKEPELLIKMDCLIDRFVDVYSISKHTTKFSECQLLTVD